MNNKVTSVTLASYAMIKALTDSNEYRSQYEILAEFIKYIIVKYRLKSFQLVYLEERDLFYNMLVVMVYYFLKLMEIK